MKRDIEKSRPYEYGEGKEFSTREDAMKKAMYKKNSMLAEIEKLTEIKLNGQANIVDVHNGTALQVQIPIIWES